jgi:hypothetical protein
MSYSSGESEASSEFSALRFRESTYSSSSRWDLWNLLSLIFVCYVTLFKTSEILQSKRWLN